MQLAAQLPGPNCHPPVLPLDDGGEARIVLEQALAAETQEIISEVRILEAQFQELVIGDGEHLGILDTLDGLCPTVVWSQKSQLPDHAPGPELDPDLAHAELAGDDVKHLVRRIALAKDPLVLAILPSRHERLEPIHREIAVSGGMGLA